MAREAAGLLEFVGPLEELVLDIDDLRLFLSPFLDLPESQVSMEYSPLPSIKGLIIAERLEDPFDEERVAAIVGFVRSQYIRGVPFERVVFHVKFPPAGMAEWLGPWVPLWISLRRRFQGTIKVSCSWISAPVCSRFLKRNM